MLPRSTVAGRVGALSPLTVPFILHSAAAAHAGFAPASERCNGATARGVAGLRAGAGSTSRERRREGEMKTYRVAVIPGDNIGPEVVAEGLRVLQRVAELGFCASSWRPFPGGRGTTWPRGARRQVAGGDAAPLPRHLPGAHGDPARVPDRIGSQQLMHPLRKGSTCTSTCARCGPAGRATPLRASDDIDLVVVRENTEGAPGWGAGCTGDAGGCPADHGGHPPGASG